jgi:hypothetical protein
MSMENSLLEDGFMSLWKNIHVHVNALDIAFSTIPVLTKEFIYVVNISSLGHLL